MKPRALPTAFLCAALLLGTAVAVAATAPPQPPFSLQSGPVRRPKLPPANQFFPPATQNGCTSLDDIDNGDADDNSFFAKRPSQSLSRCSGQASPMWQKQAASRCPAAQKAPPMPSYHSGGGGGGGRIGNQRPKTNDSYQPANYYNPNYFDGGVEPMNDFLDEPDEPWGVAPFDDPAGCDGDFGGVKNDDSCGGGGGGGGGGRGMGNPLRGWGVSAMAPRRLQSLRSRPRPRHLQPATSGLLRPKNNEMCRGPQGLVVVRLLSKSSEVDVVCASVGGSPALVSARNQDAVIDAIEYCARDTREVLVGGWFGDTRRPHLVHYHSRRDEIERVRGGGLAAVLCQL